MATKVEHLLLNLPPRCLEYDYVLSMQWKVLRELVLSVEWKEANEVDKTFFE